MPQKGKPVEKERDAGTGNYIMFTVSRRPFYWSKTNFTALLTIYCYFLAKKVFLPIF